MKIKILLLVSCISFGLSTANAEFEPVNLGEPTDEYLVYVDFDNPETQTKFPSLVHVKMRSSYFNPALIDKLQSRIPNITDYSQIFIAGEYLIDCDKLDITPVNFELRGTFIHWGLLLRLIKPHQLDDKFIMQPLELKNKINIQMFQKACKPTFILTK